MPAKKKIISEKKTNSVMVQKATPQKIYVTERLYFGSDQGHYGSFSCGHCNTNVDDNPFRCPKCHYWFEREIRIVPHSVGSDF